MKLSRMLPAVLVLALATGTIWVSGCSRGQPRDTRPLMIIPDMEFQRKVKAQQYNDLFADHRSMRTPPEGTVPFGAARRGTPFHTGKVDTTAITYIPVSVTASLLERGQDRYDIFCTPCHDRTGGGKGLVVGYGLVPPPSFHEERALAFDDGYVFDVITNGVRNMPGYARQIPVEDRWAIVAYFRALQRSQNATLADVPREYREDLQ